MNIIETVFKLLPWLLNVAILLVMGAYYLFNALLALTKLLYQRSNDIRLRRLEREVELLKRPRRQPKATNTESGNPVK